MSPKNGLTAERLPQDIKPPTELESNIIAKNIIFQKWLRMGKILWRGAKDKIINVPVEDEQLFKTMADLPRTPLEAGLLKVQLKWKLDLKGYHQTAFVDPYKLFRLVVQFFQQSGHPGY